MPAPGKPQTQLLKRLSILRHLIEQLPPSDFFLHALDSTFIDGLAFQELGFEVTPQYTFVIDCTQDEESLWEGMHFKTRQHIRRAEEKLSVSEIDDPQEFIDFYLGNLQNRGLKNDIDFTTFPEVFRQSANGTAAKFFARDGPTEPLPPWYSSSGVMEQCIIPCRPEPGMPATMGP